SMPPCSPIWEPREPMSVEVVTFGCRLNAAESEVIRREAQRAGFADTVVVNTCAMTGRSEEHTSELQSPYDLVCRLLLEKKKLLSKSTISSQSYYSYHRYLHSFPTRRSSDLCFGVIGQMRKIPVIFGAEELHSRPVMRFRSGRLPLCWTTSISTKKSPRSESHDR